MCQTHWTKLREAIYERGLSALVADSGEKAAANMKRELEEGRSIDSYDPLMSAYWAIGSNGMGFISQLGGNPMVLMTEPDPDNLPPFERCTICYLNWMMDEHDKLCSDSDCQKPKGEAAHYDWMITRAADDQVEVWKEMQE